MMIRKWLLAALLVVPLSGGCGKKDDGTAAAGGKDFKSPWTCEEHWMVANVVRDLTPAAAPLAAPQPTPVKRVQSAPPAPPAATPVHPESRRGIWMGLGAVAAVLGIVAIIALAPWKNTGAAPKAVAPTPVVEQPAPTPTPAPVQPAPVAAQPEPQSQPQAPVSIPAVAAKKSAPQSPANKDYSKLIAPTPQQPAAVVQQQPAAPPPQQQPQAAAPAPQPVAPKGPSRAELQEMREHLAMLNVRAGGIRTSLQTLQRSQAASGLNMRGDMQDAANLMNTYLSGADAAMNASDTASAKSFADKAEKQVEKLEKFLNR